jgi:Insertion domain in 60S ribosomal protein L10P
MPTRLKNGVIHLESEYVLCSAGKPISPEQAKLLKLLGISIPLSSRHLLSPLLSPFLPLSRPPLPPPSSLPSSLFSLLFSNTPPITEIKLAEFHIDVIGVWSQDGTVSIFEEDVAPEEEGDDGEDEEKDEEKDEEDEQ